MSSSYERPVEVHHHHHHSGSRGMAMVLELVPGFLIQTFGIGNIYGGRVGRGILIMLSYWAFCVINFFLTIVLIGFVTWPLTFILYAILSSKSAVDAVEENETHRRSVNYE